MHRLNCDTPLNDAGKETEVAPPPSSRREFLRAAAASSGAAILSTPFVPATARASIDKAAGLVLPSATKAVTPFEIHVPAAALDDLNTRLANTRWPDKEPVADWSQGVPLAKARALVDYWRTRYDWRRVERTLNALPQFRTQLDGLGIHFIHVRSRHPDALPIIISHGWPGSVIEFLQVIAPLVDPTAHGGEPDDAFHVVIPSLPGFGFSDKPTEPGWRLPRIAQSWEVLMQRLGYTRYVAQGGDWGAAVAELMGEQAPQGLVGIHVNLPATVPPEILPAIASGIPPAGLGDKELAAFNAILAGRKARGTAYFDMLTARPQAIGYGMSDSPAALAAFLLVHGGFSRWKLGGTPQSPLSTDDVLDDFTLYWLTNTGASANRLYWENQGRSPIFAAALKTDQIKVPVGVTVFPFESYPAPESWARKAYPKLTYYNVVDRGGHFAAWEQPELFADELRAAFRSVR